MSITEILKYLFNVLFGKKVTLQFTKLTTQGIEIETGNIKMVKLEFNQQVTFTATPLDRHGNPAQIEAGSAVWTFTGDVEEHEVTVEVNPENELEATVTSGEVEVNGTLTLDADGDTDEGETFPITGVATVVVDAPNAETFELTNNEPTDV